MLEFLVTYDTDGAISGSVDIPREELLTAESVQVYAIASTIKMRIVFADAGRPAFDAVANIADGMGSPYRARFVLISSGEVVWSGDTNDCVSLSRFLAGYLGAGTDERHLSYAGNGEALAAFYDASEGRLFYRRLTMSLASILDIADTVDMIK